MERSIVDNRRIVQVTGDKGQKYAVDIAHLRCTCEARDHNPLPWCKHLAYVLMLDALEALYALQLGRDSRLARGDLRRDAYAIYAAAVDRAAEQVKTDLWVCSPDPDTDPHLRERLTAQTVDSLAQNGFVRVYHPGNYLPGKWSEWNVVANLRPAALYRVGRSFWMKREVADTYGFTTAQLRSATPAHTRAEEQGEPHLQP